MVAPAITLLNENKPNQNRTDPGNQGNSIVINPRSSLLVNPNYGKLINKGPDTNYSINVNYSTDLTHPELAPNGPVQNPVLERTKTLSPVQTISIIGRDTDPSVSIGGSHISHYIRVKEAPAIASKTTQQLDETQILTLAKEILGPLYKAFISKDKYFSNLSNLKSLASNLLQDINSFSLSNIKSLLKQVDKFHAVYNSFGQLVSNKYIYEYWNLDSAFYNIFSNLYKIINNALQIKNLLLTIKKELASKGVKNKELDVLDKEISQIADKLSAIENELSSFGNELYQIYLLGMEYQVNEGAALMKDILNKLVDIFDKYPNIFNPLKNIANNILQIREELFVEGLTKSEISNIENAANQVLQITDGLTLTELAQILGLNLSEFIPHRYVSNNTGFSTDSIKDKGNFSISWNSVTLYHEYINSVSSSSWFSTDRTITQVEIKPYYATINGKTYQFIEVIVKRNLYNENKYYISDNTYTHYYIIDPRTGKILYSGFKEHPILNMPTNPQPISGYLEDPSQVISGVLQQYGYQLTQQELEEIDNLQPGQSVTVNASSGSLYEVFKITNLGNNQYQIQSEGFFYTSDSQNIAIDLTVTVPTYSISPTGTAASTTSLQISGTISDLQSGTSNNPSYTAVYNINETLPIIPYLTGTGQVIFQPGAQQGGETLQSISLPTLTTQQYQELQQGQMPPGIKPGWYYYPKLQEFVYVAPPQYKLTVGNTQITNQEVIDFVQQYGSNNVLITNLGITGNPNELAFIYLTSNGNGQMLIYNTVTGQVVDTVPIKNLQTGNSNYDLIAQMIYNQQYKTYSNEIITFQLANPNNLNSYVTNEPAADVVGSTPVYLTVDLINNTIYLQNSNGQILSSKQFSSQQDLLTYLDNNYGITPHDVYMAEYPPITTNTSSTSSSTTSIPPITKNLTTSSSTTSSTTSSNSYLSSNISSIIANTIPGTTIDYLNYSSTSSTGVNLPTTWTGVNGIITSSTATSQKPYLNLSTYNAIINNIPGTTINYSNYKPIQSINIDFWTVWNNIGTTLNNVFETLFGWGSPSISQTSSSYIIGVITPSIQLPKKYLYQNELENIQFEAQEIEQSPITYNVGAQGGAYLFGTLAQYSASISQTLANWGLQGPSQFFFNLAQSFLNLEEQAQIAGTPANFVSNLITLAKPLVSLALIEYFGPEEEATGATDTTAMPTLGDFTKSFILQGSAVTGITNAVSYFTTGKLLSPEEDIFLFTTAGLTTAGTSTLGSLLSKELTDIGITGFKNIALTDLTQSVIAQAGINVEVQEALSLQNNGKWLSPSEAKQAAISGAEMGLLFVPVDLFMSRFSSGFFGNPLFSSLAAGTTNALFMLPSGNPELIASAFGIGFVTHGLDKLITFSKISYLLESPEAQRVLDTTEAGWKLEKYLKDRMIEAGLVTEEDTIGWATTQTIQKLTEIYNDLQEKIIERELSPQDKMYLRSNGILGIRDDIIQGKEEDFAKYVRDKVPDGEKYYQAQQILKDLGKKLDKMFYGFKVNLNLGNKQRTLFYFMRSGDEYKFGFGSAGKEESFISRRSVSDITLNVAGIYNTPSDVIDTIKSLRSRGMYEDAEMLERIYKAVKSIKDILAKIKPTKNLEIEFRDYAEEYAKKYGFEYGELISTQMGDTIKEYIQENFGKKAVIYGSESVRQYLDNIAKMYGGKVIRVGKYYAIIDRYGNTIWKFRMPGDVDVIINTRDPGVLEKAAEDIAKLLNKTLRTNRFVAQEHLVIDKYRNGEHVVDLHMPNEGSEWKNVYARLSNFNDLGFPRPEPYYRDKVGVASLSQTLLDKASAVATLRQLSLHDIVEAINRGEKIDNPDYVISFLKNLLKDADYETQRNVLSEFIGNLNPGRRNIYIYLISKEFNIPIEYLTYVDPAYRNIVEKYFYKKQTYLAPATYRLKDTGDTLSLIYLGGKLTDSIYKRIPGIDRNVMKDYERIKQISKEKGILEKDWTEPNEINMEDIYKMLNPFESNTQSPKMVRVGSVIGPIGSLFESSIIKPSSISSILSSSSISNRSSSITSTSLSTSRSTLTSMSSGSLSSSLTSSSLSGSISSSLSNSTSLSPSISTSMSSSLSSSLSQSSSLSSSLSTSISTSTSTSPSLSLSTSESVSVSVSTSNPWQFAFLGIGKPKHEYPATQPELGKAKTSMSDAAYAFNKIWR